MKRIRYFIAFVVVTIISVIGSIISFIFWKNPSLNDFFAPLMGKSVQFILGIKSVFKNPQMLHQMRPCIFISNHQSNIDAWTITANHPGRTITMGKREIAFIPFFGWLYYLLGHILINRKNKRGSQGTINRLGEYLIKKNLSIWILPEGTRSKGRGLLPFKKGPFHLAVNAGLPIVPVAISSYKNLNLNKLRSGTVLFEALPLVETKNANINEITQKCHDMIKKTIERLDEEVKLFDG